MKRPKLEDFKREVNDGQDYADWYKEYYQALEEYIDLLEQTKESNGNIVEQSEHLPISDVRISSKSEAIRVVRSRAEHFENIGNHKHAEKECRCAVDIIERLVPPDNFQD